MYLDSISKMMSVREERMNVATTKMVANLMDCEWLKYEQGYRGQDALDRCFLLLKTFTGQVLKMKGDEPVVEDEHLMKWREVTKLIGEELPATIFKASQAAEDKTGFCWKETLDVETDIVSKAMANGVCDIHSHLYATCNAFIMNWISLMNQITGREQDFERLKHPMDNPVVLHDYSFSDLYQWCVLAARIRCCLYNTYVIGDMKGNQIFDEVFLDGSNTDLSFYNDRVRHIQEEIDYLRHLTMAYYDTSRFIDYAVNIDEGHANADSPYVIYAGERQILYRFFRKYLKGEILDKRVIHLVYLYERIKIEYRKELLYTNKKTGLANFKNYNARKDALSRQSTHLNLMKICYGIQTSIDAETTCLEGRICPTQEKEIAQLPYHRAILTGNKLYKKDEDGRLSLVFHLLKDPKFTGTNHYHAKTRNEWRAEMGMSIQRMHSKWNRVTGIDFAGSEVYVRPETCAHLVRYAKAWGIHNMTYHVGEDFFDIVDGMRAIDEAVIFFGLDKGCRLGHCLAMGLNVRKFYQDNHYEIVLPKQYLLDNLAWLIKKVNDYGMIGYGSLIIDLAEKCKELYQDIGFPGSFDLEKYTGSMTLRSDDDKEDMAFMGDQINTPWKSSIYCCNDEAIIARDNPDMRNLRNAYLYNTAVYQRGIKPTLFEVPDGYVELVQNVQKKIRKSFKMLGICIECNPTSNVLISNAKRYDEHPMFIFSSPESKVCDRIAVGIGTDDKGIMATSLRNEYALMAVSMKKQKNKKGRRWKDQEIDVYLKEIASNSMTYRFKKDGCKEIFAE